MQDATPDGLPTTDGELVQATLRGDRGAFDLLVGRYQRLATATAYRLLSNTDDALEVTQDAFLRAYQRLGSLSKPERFGAWLTRIVVNQALNYRRGRALRQKESLTPLRFGGDPAEHAELNIADTATASPEEETSARELKDDIYEALQGLPEKQRMALVLFSIQKLPQKKVAEMLNISVEAVKWHVFTARKKLKEKFRDYL